MKLLRLFSRRTFTASEFFRVASLGLFAVLLLHVVVAAVNHRLSWSDGSSIAAGLLILLYMSRRKEYELRLEHQALHDVLTGLPNRRCLLRKIDEAIVVYREQGTHLTILLCDVDFFKSVNDIHGYEFGDKCLLELTRRIAAQLAPKDFLARFAGNGFVILTNVDVADAKQKADAVLRTIAAPLVIDAAVVKLQVSIGIASLDAHHESPSDLIREADTAMHQAKESGRNRAEVFDVALRGQSARLAQMDAALRFALERNELALAYQPKISLIDGSVKGFELLLRWNSPRYGVIPPHEFIPIAESSGMIMPIGMWALEQACKQLKEWESRDGGNALTIAVNVSMRQLLQASFLSEVTGVLQRSGVNPASIELELTESLAMSNPLQTIETLVQLKKLGIRLALDDFGTGYSSLAQLQKLPLDVIKIDQSFVRGLGSGNAGDAAIVRLIIALARSMNLDTVAEGVENLVQIAQLTQLGCNLGQGYAFSASLNAEEAERLFRSKQRFRVT